MMEPIAGFDHYAAKPAAVWHQVPFSRVGIGADISPWGIGVKSAIVLNHYFDGRLQGSFFNLDTGRFEVEGYNVDAKFNFGSAAAALDWYPWGSVWRISPGIVFLNNNEISASSTVVGGTEVDLGDHTYYSATANAATGATPLTATGLLGLHSKKPALSITGGFGKFIPHSDRHWSFPSEFGVAFTGAPTVDVNVSGWACLDKQQKQCSSLGDPKNSITVEFNKDLQTRLTHLRQNLNKVTIYPIISTSVVYSFNIR